MKSLNNKDDKSFLQSVKLPHLNATRSKFENYCEPLLHLAGLTVSTVRTEGPSSAKDILAAMEKSDAVLVAGGDGTLMETVTGFLR